MASLKQLPKLAAKPVYERWLEDVRSRLAAREYDVDAWQKNWEFDFRRAYDAGSSAQDAVESALDFWWKSLLAESWT